MGRASERPGRGNKCEFQRIIVPIYANIASPVADLPDELFFSFGRRRFRAHLCKPP